MAGQKAVSWPPLSTVNAGVWVWPVRLSTSTPSCTTVANCPVVRTEVIRTASGAPEVKMAPMARHEATIATDHDPRCQPSDPRRPGGDRPRTVGPELAATSAAGRRVTR